ncbi:MAG: hypothetical protein M3Q72_07190 [Actinomycetota bacterium]|nr:hypothetical protein [Actinomycetota bacterium]
MSPHSATNPWDGVVGQARAVRQLKASVADPVHAYALVGPSGSTKDVAARAFAAEVLVAATPGGDAARTMRLAAAGEHPDIHEFHRVGPGISAEQARDVVAQSSIAPVEGERKVLILNEFHLVRPEAAAILLKSIEEPPPSTIFLICADFVPPELVTIASRCVRITFGAVDDDLVVELLVAEGNDPAMARVAADAASGDVDRARLLVSDDDLAERRNLFADVPARLDGSGSSALQLADDLLALIEKAAAPLVARQASEIEDHDARASRLGERGGGRKALDDRHKRELRRHRIDELRAGLWVIARSYRDAAVAAADGTPGPGDLSAAISRIGAAIEALERNPNEALLLQSLLWSLPSLPPIASSPAPR